MLSEHGSNTRRPSAKSGLYAFGGFQRDSGHPHAGLPIEELEEALSVKHGQRIYFGSAAVRQ
jgi:hypothetical protein